MAQSKEAEILDLRRQWQALRNSSSTWRSHWGEIRDYMLPYHGSGLTGDSREPRGGKNTSKIISNAAGFAIRTLASGLHGGLTSPARPWLRLGFEDPALEQSEENRQWLFEFADVLLGICARSNLYSSLHALYEEIPGFGTGAMLIEDDEDKYARAYTFTTGEYELSVGPTGEVDSLWRKIWMTARQIIDSFGIGVVSEAIKQAYRRPDDVTTFPIIHVIRPRRMWGIESPLPDKFAYESLYFEEGGTPVQFLRQAGYRVRPFVAPRWDVIGTDIYGRSPGMLVLPDVKQLQRMESDKLLGLAKTVTPPMRGDASVKTNGVSVIPGGITFVPNASAVWEPAYQINFPFQEITVETDRVTRRINTVFFVDLFLSIMYEDKRMTAREVVERHDEKLLLLGPTLERLHHELLDPLVDRLIDIAADRGLMPEPPPEVEGQPLKVEYISLLAQAQKLVGVNAIQQIAGFVGYIAGAYPDALDRFNADQAVEEYAKLIGVPPNLIRSDDIVEELRARRQQQQQAAALMDNAAPLAQGAKNLSEIDPTKNSALKTVLQGAVGASQAGTDV